MINKIVYIIYLDIVFIITVLHFHYSSDWLQGNTHPHCTKKITFPPEMTSTEESSILISPTLSMLSTRSLPPCPAVHLLYLTPLSHELLGADAPEAGAVAAGQTLTRILARAGRH